MRCGFQIPLPVQPSSQSNFTLPEKYLVPPPVKKGLHGGGFGPHPRGEVKGLPNAVSSLLRPEAIAPRCAEPQRKLKVEPEAFAPSPLQPGKNTRRPIPSGKPWSRLDQALRVTDLLLQAGGFSSIVLDMEILHRNYFACSTRKWFRYQAVAERSQASLLLLTQHACAKSSGGLVLRLQPDHALQNESTVFTGVEYRVEVRTERFTAAPAAMSFHCVSRRKVNEAPIGVVDQHGQACDDEARGLYACLYAKEFPAQAMLRLRPTLREKPCVVMEGVPPLQKVCSLNSKAHTMGVARSMTKVEIDTFASLAVLQQLADRRACGEDRNARMRRLILSTCGRSEQ